MSSVGRVRAPDHHLPGTKPDECARPRARGRRGIVPWHATAAAVSHPGSVRRLGFVSGLETISTTGEPSILGEESGQVGVDQAWIEAVLQSAEDSVEVGGVPRTDEVGQLFGHDNKLVARKRFLEKNALPVRKRLSDVQLVAHKHVLEKSARPIRKCH